MDKLQATEKKLKTKFPEGYRKWFASGYFNLRVKSYLWVHEAEWLSPKAIPGYDLWRITDPGLIPFSENAAGDHWCFSTSHPTTDDEYEVWFCPHDEELGERYSPTFPGWFYRNCLDYASGGIDDNEEGINEGRLRLRLWAAKLSEIHNGNWSNHLAELADRDPFPYKHPKLRSTVKMFGFITDMEVQKIVAKQFGKRYVDSKVE